MLELNRNSRLCANISIDMSFWLDYALENNPVNSGDAVQVVYLYYDGYTDSDKAFSLQKLESDSEAICIEF